MIAKTSPSVTVYETTPPANSFYAEVLQGLSAPAKELPCKYFYDEAGSRLFEQICQLPEYYLTRTELAVLRQYAAEMAALLGRRCLLTEYGSGSSLKTRLLLDHLTAPAGYLPIDISREQLLQSAQSLAEAYPHLDVRPLWADFTRPFSLPSNGKHFARRVVYFPGSTIGNFTPEEAVPLLRRTAQLCGPGGGLLLGADLKKEPALLHAAYNDSQGVTAAFNLNLLVRINRELGADFQVGQFWHHALYNPGEGRIEMYLVSKQDQHVHIAAEECFLAEGESIRTEYSYKYSLSNLRDLAATAGFEMEQAWMDEQKYFSVQYFRVR
jgi:dimethylhistidine N-methyltransferase